MSPKESQTKSGLMLVASGAREFEQIKAYFREISWHISCADVSHKPTREGGLIMGAALTPWRPFRELERLSREFEERFPRFFGGHLLENGETEYLPALESYLKDGNLVVRADLPGIDPKEVEVTVLGNTLTIKGERKEKKEIKREDYIRREMSYGSFERRMTLPEGAQTDKIKAQFKNGVVEITMPIAKEVAARKITVEPEEKK
jgi:HSP20 family protein